MTATDFVSISSLSTAVDLLIFQPYRRVPNSRARTFCTSLWVEIKMTESVRNSIYWLACVLVVVWLGLGVLDIANRLGRGGGINLIEVLVLLVVAIVIFGLGRAVRDMGR